MSGVNFEIDLKDGFRTAMREGFVHTANAFAEMLEDERTNRSLIVGSRLQKQKQTTGLDQADVVASTPKPIEDCSP